MKLKHRKKPYKHDDTLIVGRTGGEGSPILMTFFRTVLSIMWTVFSERDLGRVVVKPPLIGDARAVYSDALMHPWIYLKPIR